MSQDLDLKRKGPKVRGASQCIFVPTCCGSVGAQNAVPTSRPPHPVVQRERKTQTVQPKPWNSQTPDRPERVMAGKRTGRRSHAQKLIYHDTMFKEIRPVHKHQPRTTTLSAGVPSACSPVTERMVRLGCWWSPPRGGDLWAPRAPRHARCFQHPSKLFDLPVLGLEEFTSDSTSKYPTPVETIPPPKSERKGRGLKRRCSIMFHPTTQTGWCLFYCCFCLQKKSPG